MFMAKDGFLLYYAERTNPNATNVRFPSCFLSVKALLPGDAETCVLQRPVLPCTDDLSPPPPPALCSSSPHARSST